MQEETAERSHPLASLAKLVLLAVVAGVLVAFIALPGVGSAGLTTRDAANNFENLDSDLKAARPPEKTVVLDSKGKQIATFFDKYRESVRLDQVAPVMKQAMIDIEDSRFYEHGALDPKGAFRALATNVESGETAQGGSTLTQQYVKNLLAESADSEEEYQRVTAPTIGRKLRELRYALEVEQTMSKDKILEGYLNIAYFGAGAYGVQAAAKRYFSKDASELTLEQAALLAGITKNPTAFDPTLHPKAARDRRDTVLNRMVQLGHITTAQANELKAKPIELNETKPKGGCETSKAPFFCQYVQYEMYDILAGGYGAYWKLSAARRTEIQHKLNRGGYTIQTSLDMKKQKAVDQALRGQVPPSGHRVGAEAMVEPGSGKIRAIGVSKKFGTGKGKTSINLAADAMHGGGVGVSAGSTFKTFTLAAALEEGMPVSTRFNSPARMTISGFTDCKGKGSGPWNVGNASDSENGMFNMKTGTWHSVNTYYAQLEKQVGLCKSVKMAEKFGMRKALTGGPLDQYPSQVLGTNEIDMVHLAAAYAGFAAQGKYCEPISVIQVTDPDGKKVKLPKQDCHQAVDKDVANEVNQLLRGVLTQGTAKGIGIGRPAAGKTGTCENFSCAVFAGHTPNLAAAVAYWDPRGAFKYPVYGVFGATIPAPIWARSMRNALVNDPAPDFTQPTQDFGDVTTVPDVRGQSVGAAVSQLRAAGFRTRISRRPIPSDKPAGSVASTSPDAGSETDDGATVIIFISNGQQNNPGPGGDGGGWQWPWDNDGD